MLKAESREHLLPDAFAVAKRVEIARMQGTIEEQQLPDLPNERQQCGDEESQQYFVIDPTDQRASCKKDEQSYDEFSA